MLDGRRANAVLVGSLDKPRGAVLVLTDETAEQGQAIPLRQALDQLPANDLVDILCTQERVFGARGLPASPLADRANAS